MNGMCLQGQESYNSIQFIPTNRGEIGYTLRM